MQLKELMSRVRFQIGDPPMTFRTTALGDGQTVWYDLPKQEVNQAAVLAVTSISGAQEVPLIDYTYACAWSSTQSYVSGQQVTFTLGFFTAIQPSTNEAPLLGGTPYWRDDTAVAYALEPVQGQVFLSKPVPLGGSLVITGCSWALFSDFDLARIGIESTLQHTYVTQIEERYRDAHGFINYRETPKELSNLPMIEEPLVEMLTTINCFWVMTNDAASDSNIQTAEGTVVDRTTRYRQLMEQIQAMTQRYMDYCGQLNVGLYKSETLQLRRTSRTTGRLVPLFASREYDDHRWPQRLIPPVDARHQDNSGVPSPLWFGNWGV